MDLASVVPLAIQEAEGTWQNPDGREFSSSCTGNLKLEHLYVSIFHHYLVWQLLIQVYILQMLGGNGLSFISKSNF